MKLILTADVDNLGGPGDTVEVKDGYGRNFLMPRGLAIKATRGAEKQVDSIRRAQQARSIRGLDHANEVKDEIAALGTVSLPVRAGAKGKLFGSVGSGDVAAAVKAAGGPTLDKRTVDLPREHIKTAGKYTVTVRLHPEVSAQFALEVTVAG